MIDYRRRGDFFLFQAHDAQGMELEVQLPGFPPLGVVSTGGGASAQRVGGPFFSVFLAESAFFTEVGAAGVATGASGRFRHDVLPI